jgi:capsular polysaccharide biosynthesis protein
MIRLVLLRVLESYFRHRWFYLLPTVLMIAVAGAAFVTRTDEYIASSTFYVQKGSFLSSLTSIREAGFSWVTPAQTAVNELRQLEGTTAFIRAVVQQTSLEENMLNGSQAIDGTLNAARDDVWFTVMGDNLVMVLAINEDPEVARELVDATINSYIQWQINADREESVSTQIFFADLISSYQADLDGARAELRDYLSANPEPARGARPEIEQMEIDQLQTAVALAESRLLSAIEDEENARLGMIQAESDARQQYFVIDAAKTPTQPASSKSEAMTQSIIFVVVGIVMTIVGFVGSAIIDRSFRFAIDVHHILDLPVIAQVPALPKEKKKKKGKKDKEYAALEIESESSGE